MLLQIVRLLIDTVGVLIAGSCLLRLWMQIRRVGVRNPVGTFVLALTDWLVLPLRKIVPGAGGIDWASLIGAYLVAVVAAAILLAVAGALDAGQVFLIALIWTVRWALYLVMVLVIAIALLSWLNPFSPFLPIFDALAMPFLRPIRRILPPIGRVDLSPLVLFVIVQILLMFLQA